MPRANRYYTLFLGMILLTLLLYQPVKAQGFKLDDHTLGGHTFLPSHLIFLPFNTRHYNITMDLGAGYFTISRYKNNLEYAVFGFTSDIQQPIWKGLGLRFGIDGVMVLGIDADSLAILGALAHYEFRGGLFYNVYRTSRWSLMLSFDMSGGQKFDISPTKGVKGTIANLDFEATDLLTPVGTLNYMPGFTAAVGVFKAMGIYGGLNYTYSQNTIPGFTFKDHCLNLSLGLSFNFTPYKIPLGLIAGYQRYQKLTSSNGSNNIELGLYYVKGTHFAFGVSVKGVVGFNTADTSMKQFLFQIGFTYFE